MSNIKISIIVPVYKVEKYLPRCLESLVNQTLQDIEIVCIHDGSPDNCLNILKEYQEKYGEKIVIIDKKNEGVWKGRFDGIKVAKGEYIAFTDSDDYVALDYAEKLYNAAKNSNADISICGFYRIDMDTEHIYSKEMTKMAGKVVDMDKNPEDILSINGALWNKIYKAELLKNMDNMKNPPKVLDDMMFQLLVFLKVKNMIFIKDALYYYMVREDSIMTTVRKEQVKSAKNGMIEIKEIYEKNDNGKKLLSVLDAMTFLHFAISLTLRISCDQESNLKNEMKEIKEFMNSNFSSWRKSKYLSIWYSITHKFSNLKVAIMKKIYIMKLYPLFLKIYKFMINKMKIDIKW